MPPASAVKELDGNGDGRIDEHEVGVAMEQLRKERGERAQADGEKAPDAAPKADGEDPM